MNGRDFLKATGAGMFSMASAKTLFGAPPSGKMSIAIIGCACTADHGNGFVVDPKGMRRRGFQVMNRFADLPDCEAAVVCDIDTAIGKLKDPNCVAAKSRDREYEPGWEVAA